MQALQETEITLVTITADLNDQCARLCDRDFLVTLTKLANLPNSHSDFKLETQLNVVIFPDEEGGGLSQRSTNEQAADRENKTSQTQNQT